MKIDIDTSHGVWKRMEPGDYFERPIRHLLSMRNSASHQNSKSRLWGFRVFPLPCGAVARCMRLW